MAATTEGPIVVLVHGAFADAGSWALVTERLIAAGVPVTAIVNPLRGVAPDAAYVASFINQIDGPVLAVGHSYGGMVITNAVPQTSNVVGLVYVAAFAPDEGETLAGITGRSAPNVLLIPGTKTRAHLADNLASAAAAHGRERGQHHGSEVPLDPDHVQDGAGSMTSWSRAGR